MRICLTIYLPCPPAQVSANEKKKSSVKKKKRSSSILTCFLCTCFGYTYCKLHRIYTNPLVYSVINNMYPWFVTTALLFYENGLFLTRSEIRLASSYLEKKKKSFANILCKYTFELWIAISTFLPFFFLTTINNAVMK